MAKKGWTSFMVVLQLTRLKRIESKIARINAPKATSQFSKCSKHSILQILQIF